MRVKIYVKFAQGTDKYPAALHKAVDNRFKLYNLPKFELIFLFKILQKLKVRKISRFCL